MNKSTTFKSVVLLVLGIVSLIYGTFGVYELLSAPDIKIDKFASRPLLFFLAGIVLVYKILVKTNFKSQKFELKEYWKKEEEKENNVDQ